MHNNIVVSWLLSSMNIQKKLRIFFHGTKFRLDQIKKGARKETSTDNRHTVLSDNIDFLFYVTKLGVLRFEDGEKELEFVLKHADMMIHEDHFRLMLKVVGTI